MSNVPEIGRIERVGLREVWPNEEKDFTPWLKENIDILGETIDRELSEPETEADAGDFRVDIVAQDSEGNVVVVENQLTPSDHNHLGKLITYRSMYDAPVAIWIVSDARPEHVKAVAWLNESSDADFYLIKLEAVRIAESPPAPLLTVIVGPSEEAKRVGKTRRELAEREKKRLEFWTQLIERARDRTPRFADHTPQPEYWIAAGAGKSGLQFSYVIYKDAAQVELYIDKGKGAEEWNKRVFHELLSHKQEIEEKFGAPLDWQELPDRRACRIAYKIEGLGGWKDEEKWPQLQEAMIDAMERLEKAFTPFIEALEV